MSIVLDKLTKASKFLSRSSNELVLQNLFISLFNRLQTHISPRGRECSKPKRSRKTSWFTAVFDSSARCTLKRNQARSEMWSRHPWS